MSIKVENLTKIYGQQRAIDNISFEAKQGEVLGLLGPNGAGKSTTMKILTGYIPQNEGKAFICGIDVSTDPIAARKKIGYLPESNPLYYDMYVVEYLEFMAKIHKLGINAAARIEEMIEATGLTRERTKLIGQLSKGYKQRVGIAQAMLSNPDVLILDEPTSGLDPNQLIEIRELIKKIGKDKTVIFSSHIMQEVEAVADRVIIINKGKIVANDNTASLQSRLSGSMTVIAQFKQAVEKSLLSQIKGVKNFRKESDGKWHFQAENNIDIRGEIFKFAVEKNLTLLEMHQDEFSLEDVFKKVTQN